MLEIKRSAGVVFLYLAAMLSACSVPSGESDGDPSEPVASARQALSHNWSASFGALGSYPLPEDVAVDGSGNVIMVGSFFGALSFGGSTLSSGPTWEAGYVAAYSSTGTHLWSRSLGPGVVFSVGTDSSDNVIVSGVMYDDIDFGGGTVANNSSTGSSMFVAQYDSSGNHVWSSSYGDGLYARGFGIAVDSSDNVVIVGDYDGDLAIGSDSALSGKGIFLAKFDSSGTPLFARFFEPSNVAYNIYSRAVAVDQDDDSIVIAGGFRSTVDFGTGSLTSSGGGAQTSVFIAKFDDGGNALWGSSFGNGGAGNFDVAVDSSGNVLVSGNCAGSIDFGSNTPTLSNSGGAFMYLAKLDGNGVDLWSKALAGVNSYYHSLAVTSSDDVVLAGNFWNTVNLGGANLTSGGSNDVFVAQWDATGAHVASTRFGSTGHELGACIAVDASDNLALLGIFDDTVSFGGGTLTVAGDDYDVFLAHLAP